MGGASPVLAAAIVRTSRACQNRLRVHPSASRLLHLSKPALDAERPACTAADQVAASLRVEVATLNERAARAYEGRQRLEDLQPGNAAGGRR